MNKISALNENKTVKGTIFDIKKYAIHDGPGIRTTVFFKGCPLSCQWCHNPEGIRKEPERAPDYDGSFKLDPASSKSDLIGEEVTAEAVFEEIMKDRIYYEESRGGVTFSGGEPFLQPEFLDALLSKCGREEIHAAVDTAGSVDYDIINDLAPKIDLFLYDVKILDPDKHEKYTGIGNEKILTNFEKLTKQDVEIHLRFPVIPGITDDTDNINALLDFIGGLRGISKINLLPYHDVTKKYDKLNKEYRLSGLGSVEEEKLENIKRKFENEGIRAEIGG